MRTLSLQHKPWITAIIIVVCGIALDFGTKVLARQSLLNAHFFLHQNDFPACTGLRDELRREWYVQNNSRKIVLIPNVAQFRYVENCGSSFRLLDNIREGIRFPFLMIIGIIAVIGVPLIYLWMPARQKFVLIALPLIVAGAVGNLIDRIHYRYVVDFIDCFVVFRGNEYHWPTFNIADALILVGLALMGWQIFRDGATTPENNGLPTASRPGDTAPDDAASPSVAPATGENAPKDTGND